MRKCLLLIIIISCLPLSGCWDAKEPERMHYAHALGIDYKKGKLKVYIQIINMSNLGKTESGSSGQMAQADVGHASGETFGQAVFKLYKNFDRRVYWGHLSYVIFSEKALKHNELPAFIDFMDRYRETRYRIFFYGTNDDIQKELLATPIGNIPLGLSKLSDPKSIFKQSSLVHFIDLRTMIKYFNEPNHQILLPFISLDPDWKSSQKPKPSIKTNAVAVITGPSKNKVRAIFSGDSIRGLRWIEDGKSRNMIPLIKGGKRIGTIIAHVKKAKITPVTESGQLKFRINLKVKASIDNLTQKITVSEMAKLLSKEISSQVNETYLKAQEKNIDIYRFSEVLYRQDNQRWKKRQKDGQIPLDRESIQITVNTKIWNIGKQNFQPTLQ
jgi:spore germination protein KC